MGLLFGPAAPLVFRANEPAGLTTVVDRTAWAAIPPFGSADAFGMERFVSSDPEGTAPFNPTTDGYSLPPSGATQCLRIEFPEATLGTSPVNYRVGFTEAGAAGDLREIYVCMEILMDAAWEDTDSATKFWWFAQQNGNNHFVDFERGAESKFGTIHTQGDYSNTNYDIDTAFKMNPSGGPDSRGTWIIAEWHLRFEEGANSTVKNWVNGTNYFSFTNADMFDTGDTLTQESIKIQPTGSAPNPYIQDFYMYLGRVYISGSTT